MQLVRRSAFGEYPIFPQSFLEVLTLKQDDNRNNDGDNCCLGCCLGLLLGPPLIGLLVLIHLGNEYVDAKRRDLDRMFQEEKLEELHSPTDSMNKDRTAP